MWILLRTSAFALLATFGLIGASGAPASLDAHLAEDLIRASLADHPPSYELNLEGAKPDPAVEALERAGTIEYVSTFQTCSGEYQMLRQTERGQALAASYMWPTAYDILTVPVGRFVYVQNSERVNARNGSPASVTFKFRFVGNANVARLLNIAPASSWHLQSPEGLSVTLADAGMTLTETLPVERVGQNDHAEWVLDDEALRHGCISDTIYGAPVPAATPTAVPPITPADVTAMTLANLNYNTPRVTVNLNCSEQSPAVDSLERAGILERVGYAYGCLEKTLARLRLTERGLQLAADRGWVVGSGFLSIPVGRLKYVTSSYAVDYSGSDARSLTFGFQFQGNANVDFLLGLGPARQWCVHAFPPPPSLSLADVGRSGTRTVLILRDGSGWSLLNNWLAPVGC